MVEKEEAKREKWTEREISVDHPDRKKWNIRDPSIFTAGLTTNIVGLHCDIAIMDDIVVESNAYVEQVEPKVQEPVCHSVFSRAVMQRTESLEPGTILKIYITTL